MKIQYMSDLHLEFKNNSKWVMGNALNAAGEYLILAGDICHITEEYFEHPFFDWCNENFKHTFWVPGNHEFYSGTVLFDLYAGELQEKIRDNVSLVNNVLVCIKDVVNIILSAGWSKIGPLHEYHILKGMNDFKCIAGHEGYITTQDFNKQSDIAWNFIEEALKTVKQDEKNKTIVVTHYLPTFKVLEDKWVGDNLNEGFAIEKSDVILDSNATYWIYGHSHGKKSDVMVGETLLVSNQLGYVDVGEHRGFKGAKIINL